MASKKKDPKEPLKGNKGEWSEIYALLKILGDQSLFPGDASINKIEGLIYPVLEIIRTEASGDHSYTFQNKQNIRISTPNHSSPITIPISEFIETAKYLFEKIKASEGAFTIDRVESFMKQIGSNSLKAKSQDKADIHIVINDPVTLQTPRLSFSIKSQLGAPSTLLNANKDFSNFKYQVIGQFTSDQIQHINQIDSRRKIKDRLEYIYENGGKLKFAQAKQKQFADNLILIDSLLPEILAHITLTYYATQLTSMPDLVNEIEHKNPLDFNTNPTQQFYSYKVKRLLTDSAFGMTVSTPWSGEYRLSGGYLIIKEDGEIICYHLINKKQIEEYLITNTKLDTPSTSRHNHGILYKENEKLYIDLGLQIKFRK